ncbi:MAG TPA: cytochrome c [Casimicrobiaceae bacterium]|nr:cytochrome c [Casimicrobiaceae bacterium]
MKADGRFRRGLKRVAPVRALPRRLTGLVGAALALGVAAAEPELTVTVSGRMATYAPAALLGLPSATTLTIPNDVAYKREMTYRAVPMAGLLTGAAADESIRFVAQDGFVATLPVAPLLARDGAVAYLAVESSDAPWPALKAGKATSAGPFYLVWLHPERGGIVPAQWPYRIARIESVAPLARRYPALAPAPGLSARDPARHGFAVYERYCATCHTLNMAGDANIGPDLNVPYNPTEYMRVDSLRHLIRDPQSLRRWPGAKMPGFGASVLSDRDLNDLLAYLRHMADRKVSGLVAK